MKRPRPGTFKRREPNVLLSWQELVAEEELGAQRTLSVAEFEDILRQLTLQGA